MTIFLAYASTLPGQLWDQGTRAAAIMFGLEAGLDVLIAGVLVTFLLRKVKPRSEFAGTDQLIKRIVLVSM